MGSAALTGWEFLFGFAAWITGTIGAVFFVVWLVPPARRDKQCAPFAPGTAFNPYPPSSAPRKGYTRKGGQNPPQSQVRERPDPPAPLRSGGRMTDAQREAFREMYRP